MRLLFPILLILIGVGGGVGAGLMLRPDVPQATMDPSEPAEKEQSAYPNEDTKAEEDAAREYVKLNNQFVVPVIEGERVASMVVMSLSIEVVPGNVEAVYAREPKLRDAFLQVMFDHANVGGFSGKFTNSRTLDVLRRALLESSYHAVGDLITDVLITEIARQDV